jgi:glycerol-3-phosphate dehydrogenase
MRTMIRLRDMEEVRPLSDRRPLAALSHEAWDLVVVGGGITGAGIFREAALAGLRVLLVEARDFASGTSSRSSKLVHGGLHYLGRMDLALALEASRERDRLLRDHGGLVRRIPFVLPLLSDAGAGRRMQVRGLVGLYRALSRGASSSLHPGPFRGRLSLPSSTRGLLHFSDGQTDDAGLVLRVLRQGVEAGGVARNHTRASVEALGSPPSPEPGAFSVSEPPSDKPAKDPRPRVRLEDPATGASTVVAARVVVNATGPWCDLLPGQGHALGIRKVRGSHLVLPWHRLPLTCAVVHLRPTDGSAVIMVPWGGVTLVGGTSVECQEHPERAACSPGEMAILLDDVKRIFPRAGVTARHVQSTFAGIRPLVDRGEVPPALASRRGGWWEEGGVVTVAGGKLTTFRAMARDTLERVRWRLPPFRFRDPPAEEMPPSPERVRLHARYGGTGAAWIGSHPSILQPHAELVWSIRHESPRDLDDLLLRRSRLGLVAPHGGRQAVQAAAPLLQDWMGWDSDRWRREMRDYAARWHRSFRVPRTPDQGGFRAGRERAPTFSLVAGGN